MTSLQNQLNRLAARGPVADPRFVIRRAIQLAASDTPPTGNHAPMFRPRFFGMVAAATIGIAGVVGALYVWSGANVPVDSGTPTAGSMHESGPLDTTTGSLVTTLVPPEVQPLPSIGRPDWAISSTSGFQLGPTAPASAACPGCGAKRLVLAADGPLFTGALFSSWTINSDYDLDQLDSPVVIGAVTGRANSRPEGTPTALNRMTIAWQLGPGRTAFVDASGLSNQQVVEMASLLTFESEIPVMPVRPAGFRQIDAPAPGTSAEIMMSFTDGYSSIELYATNTGLHGLLDWRAPGHLLARELKPYLLNGTTIAFDAYPAVERPIVALDAYWVAGGWGWLVVGHLFDSEAQFFDVLADLQLTDRATFAEGLATAQTSAFDGFTSATGWSNVSN